MAGRAEFYKVVNEAIADFTEHGFDSQERLDRWMLALQRAARGALVPEAELQREVASMLTRVYDRAVGGGLARAHPGIGQFTLQQIKPKLRLELDRHILASTSLIKLNREASVQRAVQRLAGWATSIPVGGSDVVDKADTKESVRRSIAGLPFEERRVVIDQGLKLASSINTIVAVDGGAIFAYWKHVREGGGYQARIEHERRNDVIFVVRDNWALKAGFMKLDGCQYTDQVEQPGEFVFCRCSFSYRYNLRDLPESMRTSKGRDELARVQSLIRGMRS